jgi:hypothetical protein
MYGCYTDEHGRIAYDQKGSEFDPNTGFTYNLLCDADPPEQRFVESTGGDEPVDATGHPAGRAPPWGKHDLPPGRSVTEPRMATDPPTSARQERAMRAAEHGTGRLNIPPHVAREFHDPAPATPSTISQGQQGGDQEHLDKEQDEELIDRRLRQLLKRLKFSPSVIEETVAEDRARRAADRRRRMAGDRALARRSFHHMFPETERLESHGSGAVAFTPRVFVHRSRG